MIRLTLVMFSVAVILHSTPAEATLRVEASYSAPADLFSLMDQVSLWSPDGFNKPKYREHWKKTFGTRFFESCNVGYEDGFYELLEEPLAVAWGNAAFRAVGRFRARIRAQP